jgi:Xaa-Pro dipeptidase
MKPTRKETMTTPHPKTHFQTDENVPAYELKNRIAALQARLSRSKMDAALILQSSDLYYFSGTTQQGHLYVPADSQPILMVRKSIDRATAESNLDTILPLSGLSQLRTLLKGNGCKIPQTLGMELDVLPVNLYHKYRDLFDESRIVDASHDIRMVRSVKSPFEIDRITQAAAFSDQVASFVKEELREGITEVELAGKLEARARKLGHQGMVRMRLWGSEMFYGHLMSGATAAVPSALASPTGGAAMSPAFSQGPGFKKIQRHEPILFDYVFAYKGYLSDHTRIFSIGSLPHDILNAHQAMLDLQSMLKKKMLPGVPAGDVYDMAMAFVDEAGYGDSFMGAEKQRIRFIGHGVGLELDEYPFLARGQQLHLQADMVIALEPKLVFPGRGVVGVENTHVVTSDGLQQLTTYPEEIEIL